MELNKFLKSISEDTEKNMTFKDNQKTPISNLYDIILDTMKEMQDAGESDKEIIYYCEGTLLYEFEQEYDETVDDDDWEDSIKKAAKEAGVKYK